MFEENEDFDNEYIITNLQFVQRLLEKPNLVSAIELKLSDNTKANVMVNTIQTLLGDTYKVRTRYQQDEAFLKLMNMEKWMSFAILTLTLLLVAFNLIGSLWMIVLEKKQDIAILKSMGSLDSTIQRVFLYEGGLLCLVGLIVGFVLAFGIYFVQKAFGIIPIPEGFVVDAYPMSIRWTDFLAVTSVVFIVGLIASLPAAYRAKRIPALIREE
jgi:lipoprotein-releasing system permease protein